MPRAKQPKRERAEDEVRKTISFRTSNPKERRNLEWYESFGEKRSSVAIHLIHDILSEYLDRVGWYKEVPNRPGRASRGSQPPSSSAPEDEITL